MIFNFELILSSIAIVWLIVLTYFFWKMSSHYNNLTKETTGKNLVEILEAVIKELHGTKKEVDRLKEQCAKIEKDGLLHIQKVGLIRFNPFKDTGGDQSFILALINGNNTGVVISGLYSRSGTRWYAKKIVGGKGTDHDLSDEEKKAVQEASIIA